MYFSDKINVIESVNSNVFFGSILNLKFTELLNFHLTDRKIFILVDENTEEYCLPNLLANFSIFSEAEIISIPAGESSKSLEIAAQIWDSLLQMSCSREDVLINLGGGVVCDLGAFVASVFKRGINYINIPTSLLAMVDASVGGKNGIDFANTKNALGLFSFPLFTWIDDDFLSTLPLEEKNNGLTEMLKHGLIADKNHWEELKSIELALISLEHIYKSVSIKNSFVLQDVLDKNVRKSLNYGHTLAHAIESIYLSQNKIFSHGQAVLIGMILENLISNSKNLLPEVVCQEINDFLISKVDFSKLIDLDAKSIFSYIQNDKKNTSNSIKAVLLKNIGEVELNVAINMEELSKGIKDFNQLKEKKTQ